MSIIKKIFTLSSLTLSGWVFGATITTGEWTTPAKVVSIGIYGTTFRVETDTTDNTSAVCSSSNGAYWWWTTDPASKEIYSMLLAAHASGKKITVSYTDECNNSAKKLRYIVIRDN